MKHLGTIKVDLERKSVDFQVYDQTFRKNPNDLFTFWTVVTSDYETTNEVGCVVSPTMFLVIGKAVSIFDCYNHKWYPVELTPENLSIINSLQQIHAQSS